MAVKRKTLKNEFRTRKPNRKEIAAAVRLAKRADPELVEMMQAETIKDVDTEKR